MSAGTVLVRFHNARYGRPGNAVLLRQGANARAVLMGRHYGLAHLERRLRRPAERLALGAGSLQPGPRRSISKSRPISATAASISLPTGEVQSCLPS